MWQLINGRLNHTTDKSRVKFRTNISKEILDQLTYMAEENDTHVNYLLENGLSNLLSDGIIHFDKNNRPKDRVQYKTTYDNELLNKVKLFAASNRLFINDVIEYSTKHINIEEIKLNSYRYRIERK